jgi:mRNA interferase RelE/StbE
VYDVKFARRAEEGLRRIEQGDPRSFLRVVSAIRSLADQPRPAGAAKVKAFGVPTWRLRVADYRIVYEIHEREVLVIFVDFAPRGDVYR